VPEPPVDTQVIGNAPIGVETVDGENAVALEQAYREIGYLSDLLAESEAEVDRLTGKATVDDVRAQMLQPFAEKVFAFVALYCVAVFALLIASGQQRGSFHLSDTVLSVIAGSTAVSVIGLIGMVISGLFGGTRH
jgi:hypothetical protein